MKRSIVSQEEWVAARKQLLTKEKELTKLQDEVSRQRRELPWVLVRKEYVFDTLNGKKRLAELFRLRWEITPGTKLKIAVACSSQLIQETVSWYLMLVLWKPNSP